MNEVQAFTITADTVAPVTNLMPNDKKFFSRSSGGWLL